MQEIGGYLELDTYVLPILHEKAIALNSGRNALAYLIRAKKIRKILIPKFICDSIVKICEREGVTYRFYGIESNFLPSEDIHPEQEEWFYFVNYYSQIHNEQIKLYTNQYRRIIVDNVQSYFQEPISGIDTIYTCRKYFGVSDGAFLYTESRLQDDIETDESFDRIRFILGRFERTGSEFYSEYLKNENYLSQEPLKRMSKLTNNLLHAIDYGVVQKKRETNFSYLHENLRQYNRLDLTSGTFMYPFMIPNGRLIRKKLQREGIYIPLLWPDVLERLQPGETEYKMAEDILPLPIDQRYDIEDMKRIIDKLRELIVH